MSEKQPSYVLFFIGLLPFIMVVGNSMFILLVPQMQSDLGLTTVEGGLLLTSFSIPAALLVPIGGVVSDRYGRKQVALIALALIMIGCVVSSIGAMMNEVSGAFSILIVGRVIQGVGAGAVTPLAMAFITDVFEGEHRNRALGTIEVFNGAGKIISPILGGVILAFSWYGSFVLFLAICLFAFLGIILFTKSESAKKIKQDVNKSRRLHQFLITEWRWLVPIFTAGFVGMFLLFGYLFYFAYLLEMTAGYTPIVNGFLLAIPVLFMTILSYFASRVLKGNVNNYKRAFLYGGFTLIFASLMMIINSTLAWFAVSIAIYSIGLGIILPAANSALANVVSPSERGAVFSLYSMIRFLGVALGPLCFGYWIINIEQMMFTSLFFVSLIIVSFVFSWNCFPLRKDCSVTDL
ncbi:multidrug resistance protein [Halalkalibacter wakoensis JCM 9140]|uniref:Multidrug resistance protein n=1 Tax=Halalkalibacter wakoensis JCM 9140 TaxID=1236970 RepID=W4PYD7_9BACI|nr:MFS transporter [Halalkalibacter wakoensis]GAE24747.1 multidrug resistance protein [Halalkalibacter wakoensis JCM 9140]